MTTAILTLDDIRHSAPSVFATQPWHRMSERYRHVPTIEVVDILRDRGFFPVKASQSRSRIEGKEAFTRHMLRFRHADYLTPQTVGAELPELILSNSHDGIAAHRFSSGIVRLVCSNGLVVGVRPVKYIYKASNSTAAVRRRSSTQGFVALRLIPMYRR